MSKERKLISFDWAIKRILRHKANFNILEGFLSELLQENIKINTILESESNRELRDARSNRVDLLVENSKKELIIVEIQYETEYDYLQRMLFGVSKLLVEYMKKSAAYSKIRKIISISIVYFDLGQGEDYAYKDMKQFVGLNKKRVAPATQDATMSADKIRVGGKVCFFYTLLQGINKKDILKLNSTQQALYKTEKISDIYPEYYILKVNQFDDIARNTIDEWIYFLKNEEIKDEFKAKGLKEAKKELDILKMDEEERREYEEYLEAMRYEASMFESSYKVGEMKGEENKAVDMAKKLKEKGIDIDIISETSGLSNKEIEEL